MPLPAEFAWLNSPTLAPLPKVVQEALSYVGVKEVVGRGSNKTILRWRDELNAAGIEIKGYSDDDIAWCGLFVGYICLAAGKPVQVSPLWARNWGQYGTEVATRRKGKLEFVKGLKASLGDILVYERPGGGGHVEFYIGETATMYVGVGGNKNNQVKIGPMAKSRCIAVRRPPMKAAPASARPFVLASVTGAPTTNEA